MNKLYDLIILGSGPAGYTCAIYTSRGGFKVLILTGVQIGGQLILAEHIENFPGFPEGVTGSELMGRMRKQAEKFGAEVVVDQCQKIEKKNGLFKIIGSGKEYLAKAVVVATGASALWLPVAGLGKLKGKGISACATCDGPFFKDKTVCVIGGGDTAFTETEFLTRFAKRIFLIHRRENFRAEKILQERILANKKVIPLYNSQVIEFLGEQKLEAIKIESKFKVEGNKYADLVRGYPKNYSEPASAASFVKTSEAEKASARQGQIIWQLPVAGAFIAIGHKPDTDVLKGFLDLDENGYVKTHNEVITSISGVFACGDVVCNVYKQATIAVGTGCKAAIEAQKYLRK